MFNEAARRDHQVPVIPTDRLELLLHHGSPPFSAQRICMNRLCATSSDMRKHIIG